MMKDEVDTAALNAFYRGINELLGTEAMMKLYEQYRGMQITIPIHLYDRKLVAELISAQYDGHNSYQLARKYGYSQRWVTKALRESKKIKKQSH